MDHSRCPMVANPYDGETIIAISAGKEFCMTESGSLILSTPEASLIHYQLWAKKYGGWWDKLSAWFMRVTTPNLGHHMKALRSHQSVERIQN